MRYLRSFIVLFKNQVQNSTEYRSMVAIWVFEGFFVPFVMLMVWVSLASYNPHLLEQKDTIIIYYLSLPIFTMLTGAWHSSFFANKVRSGQLNMFLTKPIPYILYDLANNFAEKTVKLVLLLPMILVGWWFYPASIELSLDKLILLAVIVFMSASIKFAYESVIAYISFWLDDIQGLINFTDIAEYTIGGRFIPIFLFPAILQTTMQYVPFRYFIAFPAEFLSGSLNHSQIVTGVTQQVLWTTVFSFLAFLLWKRGVKAYGAVGG